MTVDAGQRTKSRIPIVARWAAVGAADLDLGPWIGSLVRDFGSDGARIASRCIAADDLRGQALTDAAREVFLAALTELPGGPCRVWTFLPRPTDRDDDSFQRYMRFNTGRTDAYRRMAEHVRVMPAGTCVGHAGNDLVVHALWLEGAFTAVENPRQRPAWLYSDRFGPVPPAFTRATRTDGLLFASGTASVIGEESMHHGQLEAQFDESVRNLSALADAGGGDGAWRALQIYVRDAADLDRVEVLAKDRFGDRVERILHAPICRHELLLEIEGICRASKP